MNRLTTHQQSYIRCDDMLLLVTERNPERLGGPIRLLLPMVVTEEGKRAKQENYNSE